MKLINPTDDQLDAAFAENVAGWTRIDMGLAPNKWLPPGAKPLFNIESAPTNPPGFTQSADAVLPWLEKMERWRCDFGRPDSRYRIYFIRREGEAVADTFPRAAVIALLRAHGVEVEFTK